MQSKENCVQPQKTKDQELILVIKRSILLGSESWQGIRPACFETYAQLIQQHKEFLPRGLMEQDSSYKQIIPYLVFEHNEHYFLMQRSAQASEDRLQNQYSLGIGGHIRQEDMINGSIIDWARREFYEEINYDGTISVDPIGILNDDSNAVGLVHIGFVFIIKGNSANISIKSELQSGKLVPLEECMQYNKNLETWSQIVLSYLLDQKYGTTPKKCCC
jgi:predicted NUDIX family phosphoesterase